MTTTGGRRAALRKTFRRLLRRSGLPMGRLQQPGSQQHRKPPRYEFAITLYRGDSLFDLKPIEGVSHSMLTRDHIIDRTAAFVADPFIVRVDGRWHMFFEVLNQETRKGEIGLAYSDDGLDWRYQRIVHEEPFHLSYPYIFASDGDFYMIPESAREQAVYLYRAVEFPWRWSRVATLLSGQRLSDPSVVRVEGRWWLFASAGNPPYYADHLFLFHAVDLAGPWRPHPANPIVRSDPHIARPAGRVLVHGGKVIRFAQDCAPRYGIRVRAFEATELSPGRYTERPAGDRPVLEPGDAGWNAAGMASHRRAPPG